MAPPPLHAARAGAPAAGEGAGAVVTQRGCRRAEGASRGLALVAQVACALLIASVVLLAGVPGEAHQDSCGWSPQDASLCCVAAASCFLLCLAASTSQALWLASCGPRGRGAEPTEALIVRHALLPAAALVPGLGAWAAAVAGYASVAHGLCGAAAAGLPAGSAGLALGCGAFYLWRARRPRGPRPPRPRPHEPPGGRRKDARDAGRADASQGGSKDDSGSQGSSQVSEEADLSLPLDDQEQGGSVGFGIVPVAADDAHRRVSTMSTTSQGVKRHSTKSNRGTPAALPRMGLDAPVVESTAPGREPMRKSLTKAREAQLQALTATPLDTDVAAVSSADRFSRVFADRRSSFRSNSSKSLESLPDRQWQRTFTAGSRASSSAGPLLARLHEEEDAAGGPSQRPHREDPPAIIVSPPVAEATRGAQGSPKGPTVKRGSRGNGEPEARDQFSQLDAPVLYHKESPINFGTLAKRSPCSSSSSGSGSGEDDEADSDDSDGELWCGMCEGQVEVPIWLMEKLKSRGPPSLSAEERRMLDRAQERASRDSSGSVEIVAASHADPRPPRGSSFCAPPPEQLPGISEGEEGERSSPVGVRFEEPEGAEVAKKRGRNSGRQSALKKYGNGGSARTSRSDLAASQRVSVRTTTAPVKPQNFFWKIPMPSRKNTVQTGAESLAHLPEENGSDDEGEDDGAAASSSSGAPVLLGSNTSTPAPRGSLMRHVGFDEGAGAAAQAAQRPSQSRLGQQGAKKKTSLCLPGGGALGAGGPSGQLQPPQKRHSRNLLSSASVGSRGSRRPSALGAFSDGFSSTGLYVLPRDPAASCSHEDSEIVEVRRESVVLSPTMMEGILKCKSLGSRLSQQLAEEVGTHGEEIVLPLFTQKKSNLPHQCTCQVDPLTGHVIHTCMTPKSTRCTNTEVMQSYVCSEWHSKVGTRTRGSFSEECAAFVGSRRGSLGDPSAAEPQPYDVHRKRIRNETVLGMMSRGPAPAKQDVEDDDDADFEKPGEEGKAEGPVGDQLVVSFSSIQNSQKRGSHRASFCEDLRFLGGAGGAGSPSHGAGELEGAATPEGAAGMYGDAQVESELGHRFDLLEPEALGAMLGDLEGRERLLIVDVRGRDWVGGHIPSSINLRTSEVTTHPESLLAQCRQNRIQTVVFTCMYSVLRARKCATALEQVQNEEQKSGHAPYRLRVYLLRGGMHAWVNHYVGADVMAADPPEQFLVNFQPEMWSDGGPSQGGLVHVMDALWSSGGQKALTDALTQELSALAAMASRDNSSHTSTIHNSRRPSENDPAA